MNGKSAFVDGGAGNDYLSGSSYAFDSEDNPIGGITLSGGAGDDFLSGDGHVTLIGGAGSDLFSLSPNSAITVADFTAKDVFVVGSYDFRDYDYTLKKYVVPSFDPKNLLAAGTDPKATSALAQFLYDTDDGKLYYDADGIGLKFEAELVATLSNKAALDAVELRVRALGPSNYEEAPKLRRLPEQFHARQSISIEPRLGLRRIPSRPRRPCRHGRATGDTARKMLRGATTPSCPPYPLCSSMGVFGPVRDRLHRAWDVHISGIRRGLAGISFESWADDGQTRRSLQPRTGG